MAASTDVYKRQEQGQLTNNTVVTTVMSNLGLYKAFDAIGVNYEKTAVGDKYVYENMVQNGHRIGGEESGHIIFSKYATTGDGILTSLKPVSYTHLDVYKRQVETMNVNESGIDGMKEVVFMITGQGAFSRLKYESGVHRVQRVPETESGGRIHTSTATVAIMPDVYKRQREGSPVQGIRRSERVSDLSGYPGY